MPERLLGKQEKRPESGSKSQVLLPERKPGFSVHEAAKEAARRGRTLMVFMQADNKSVPYEVYLRHLESGGLAIGTPRPVALKADSPESCTPSETPPQNDQLTDAVAQIPAIEAGGAQS
jgi:hypothetical protein